MKKFMVVLAIVCVAVCSVFSVSAASKQDVIDKLGEIPSAIENKTVFYNGAVQMIKNSDLTEDQLEQLMPLLDELKTVLPENKGPAARNYTKDQINKVLDILDRGCKITNYSYETTHLKGDDGGRDFAIKLYDQNHKLVMVYNDGQVRATGVEDASSARTYVWLAGGVALLGVAVAVAFVAKKKVSQ